MEIVTPGEQLLTSSSNINCGNGTYIDEDGVLRASIFGSIERGLDNSISVISSNKLIKNRNVVVNVDDIVICRVIKITMMQATVDILSVDGIDLLQSSKGIIRREDVRLSEIDKIIMQDCFLPGDIIRAIVISLGDAKQYYLSSAAVEFGVIHALSLNTKSIMKVLSWKEIQCPKSNIKEFRKCMKPDKELRDRCKKWLSKRNY